MQRLHSTAAPTARLAVAVAVVIAAAGAHAQRLHSTAAPTARLAVAVVPAIGGGAGAAPAATDGHSHLQKVLLLVPHFLPSLGFL
jgi:hypothetical protein